MMEENTIIQKFLDYLRYERRFSEHTAKCYGADLTQYSGFLSGMFEGDSTEGEAISFGSHEGPATAVATKVDLRIDKILLSAGDIRVIHNEKKRMCGVFRISSIEYL